MKEGIFVKRGLLAILAMLALVFVLAVLPGLVPEVSAAEVTASGTCGNNLTWELTDDGTLTISGTGSMTDYEQHTGWYASPWVNRKDTIIRIVIEKGVTSIGNDAFSKCNNLVSVSIPEGVTSIGSYAFYECGNLASVVLPAGVTDIGSFAFYYCTSLTDFEIPDSVTRLGQSAFTCCKSLTRVMIPDSVTSFGTGVFASCSGLVSATLPSDITVIPGSIFSGCSSLEAFSIPSSVTVIDSYAFRNCSSLKSIDIPNGVTKIGEFAFSGCAFETVILPDSIDYVGWSAFYECPALQYAEFGNAKYIGTKENPYHVLVQATGTDITEFTVHENAKVIAGRAFSGCKNLKKAVIPDTVNVIGNEAFRDCSGLESMTIPFVGERRATEAYYHPLGYILGRSGLDNNFYEAEQYNGSGSDILFFKYYIPKTLTSVTVTGGEIAHGAFKNCISLTMVVVPDGITAIGADVFYGCKKLENVNVPDGVRSIGNNAFSGCTSLQSISLPESVTVIGAGAFDGCTSLAAIRLPQGLTRIGEWAFRDCASLTTIAIPNSVTFIAEGYQNAFQGCSALEEIWVDENNSNYSSDKYGVLLNKDKSILIAAPAMLTEYKLPNTVIRIKEMGFYHNNLTVLVIPSSLEIIEGQSFLGCEALNTVHYCGTEEQWSQVRIDSSYNSAVTSAEFFIHGYVGCVCKYCGHIDAEAGETAQALMAFDLEEMTVPAGVTLDLNGYSLEVDSLVSFGDIIDTAGTGSLAVGSFALTDNSYLPIYDSVGGCYRFYAYTLQELGAREQGSSAVFGFALDFEDPAAYALLAATEDPKLDITATLSWGTESKTFAFGVELIRHYAALQAKYPALQAAMMLTVTGFETLGAGTALTVCPGLAAVSGQVTAKGEDMIHTC